MSSHPPGAPQPNPVKSTVTAPGGVTPHTFYTMSTNQYLMQVPTDGSKVEPWTPCPGVRTMYEGSDMPTQDLPENHDLPEPSAQSPDPSRFVKIRGYETAEYHDPQGLPASCIPPPPSYSSSSGKAAAPVEPQITSNVAQLNEDQVREALSKHVSQNCCYGKGAAGSMTIKRITPSSALHYKLATFVQTRSISWDQEPYKGQPVDSPQNGSAPAPWSIPVEEPPPFTNKVHTMQVPHSANVYQCHGCHASGFLRCTRCFGRGFKKCKFCNGSGRDWTDSHGHNHHKHCHHCEFHGRKRCTRCQGDGRIMCKTCQGYRQVKSFIKLTVEFKKQRVEHVMENTDMPNKLVKKVGGVLVLEQTLPKVCPLKNYPVPEINQITQNLIKEEETKHKNAHIIMQKQSLKAVPVTECIFEHKNGTGRFWVYGNECKVYTKEYPDTCCCGCVLL